MVEPGDLDHPRHAVPLRQQIQGLRGRPPTGLIDPQPPHHRMHPRPLSHASHRVAEPGTPVPARTRSSLASDRGGSASPNGGALERREGPLPAVTDPLFVGADPGRTTICVELARELPSAADPSAA